MMRKNFNHVDFGFQIPKITRVTDQSGRRYTTPEGNVYPSVTTVVSLLSKQHIEQWRKKVGAEQAQQISTQASIRGTKVHDIAEGYVNNDPKWSYGHMPVNIQSFNQIKPLLDRFVDDVYLQETYLWSDYLQTAGQVDLIAKFNGKLSIIDFKTSKKPKKRSWIKQYFMQEAFYAVAFEERTSIPVNQLVTLITVDHSNPQLFIEDRDDHVKDFIELRIQYKKMKGL